MATLYKPDNTTTEVAPDPENSYQGKTFDLKQLYDLIDCQMIEVVSLSDGGALIFDEEYLYREAPPAPNKRATELCWKGSPFTLVGGQYIHGNVLHLTPEEFKKWK